MTAAGFDEERFSDLLKLARRDTTFKGPNFDVENPTWESIRLLIVGAGGLGCELLHCLALSGFTQIDVIDMDTIDLSNLNRQFLFRQNDIGKAKAVVAAEFINKRFPWMNITAHHDRIETVEENERKRRGDKTFDFYGQFHICILGLDSIHARAWINNKFANMARKVVDGACVYMGAPVIDGGTEGFKGSARNIKYGQTACVECTMSLFPPQRGVPMCTITNTPRNAEHCVLYYMKKSWEDEKPFDGAKLDGDDPEHIVWIMERAAKRAVEFKIPGTIDFAFTQGVVKNVIPSVGFTNAMIAAMCVNEALKMATDWSTQLDNFTFYDGSKMGVTSTVVSLAPEPECSVCRPLEAMSLDKSWTPQDVIDKALTVARASIPVGAKVQLVADFGEGVGRVPLVYPAGSPMEAVTKAIQGIPVFDTLSKRGVPSDVLSIGFAMEATGGALGSEVMLILAKF